jgi:phosphohistidine phosphatase
MKRLMLLRHAKSDWPGGVGDHDRPLGPRGRHDAPRMGEEMARRGLRPELVIISTAARTRETWDYLAPHFGSVPERFDRALYAADAEAMLKVVRGIEDTVSSLLLLGHNPGLETLANLLIAEGPSRLRERLEDKFPTAALAVIDFAGPNWASIRHAEGRLSLFLTPADIE